MQYKRNGPNTNFQRKTSAAGFLLFFLYFGILSILHLLPSSADAQSSDPLLQKLDSHYYYPSQLGLKKLSARIQWLQKDLGVSQSKFIPHPDVLFSWSVKSDARLFKADSNRKGLSEARKKEIEIFFQNYREIILPRRLYQTLRGFKLLREKKAFFKTTVEYQSPFKSDEIQKYSLDIDSKHWRISQINLKRKTPPYNVVSDFKYIQREGKWLVSETLARFNLEKDSYSEKTSYTYQKKGTLASRKNESSFKERH
jgi:hypothetical protein